MHFLNPLFLLASIGVIGPIVLHLVRKEESQKVPFSSLMFVTRMPKRSWRRQKLQHLLLLMLRVAALLLLVLAFARPFFTSRVPVPIQSLKNKFVVILLDNSFSMRFGDRFEKAKKQALQLVSRLGHGDSVQIVAFSDTSQVLNSPRAERGVLESLIDGLRPSYRKTSYTQALKLANQLLASAPDELREIDWISDFQESGWKDTQEEITLGEDIRIQAYDISGVDVGNAAVGQIQISEIPNQENPLVRVLAGVPSYGLKAPGLATLKLELNGKLLQEKQLSLESNGSKPVEFETFSLPPGVSAGKVQLNFPDPLPADNVFHFALNSHKKLKLLLLGEKQANNNFYLAKALAASSVSPFTVEVQDLKSGNLADLTPFAAILLNNIETIPPRVASSLYGFVSNGGGIILVLGNRVKSNDFNAQLEKILPAQLGYKYSASETKKEQFIGEMPKHHPIFDVFDTVHHSYFLTTPFSGYFHSTPRSASHVLIKLEDGSPLLIEGTVGKGRTLLFTSSLNMDWNDLPLKSVFLPFCQQLVKYCVGFEESQSAFMVGEVIPLSKLNPFLDKALNKISNSSGSFSQSWKVLNPSGEKTDLNDKDLIKSPFFTLEEPGFYQTTVHNFKNLVAANVDPAESDLRKVEPQRILSSIRRQVGETRASGRLLEATMDQHLAWEGRQRLWWFLLLLALMILLVESFVANRYYKNTAEM
ncbi:MAG: hypothetical protein DMG05_06165 [Acidobacteria bacterium]|nr:MAG: hypothetical protein DMG05_06165 [Acidobacteriota bacterium]